MCAVKEFRDRAETKAWLLSVAEVKSDAENHLSSKSLADINWPLAPLKSADVTPADTRCRTGLLSLHTAWPQGRAVLTVGRTQPQVALQLPFPSGLQLTSLQECNVMLAGFAADRLLPYIYSLGN